MQPACAEQWKVKTLWLPWWLTFKVRLDDGVNFFFDYCHWQCQWVSHWAGTITLQVQPPRYCLVLRVSWQICCQLSTWGLDHGFRLQKDRDSSFLTWSVMQAKWCEVPVWLQGRNRIILIHHDWWQFSAITGSPSDLQVKQALLKKDQAGRPCQAA